MAKIREFEDFECWQCAREATRYIYRLTRGDRFRGDPDLVRQMRRASVSVTSNIAEGYERGGRKEFRNFLKIAKGSAGEVRSQLYVALDENFITEAQFEEAKMMWETASRKIAGLRSYLERCDDLSR